MSNSDELDEFLRSARAADETQALTGRSLRIGERIDSYEVVGFLGRGATGEVWLVRDTTTGGEYALKRFAPTNVSANRDVLRARFISEARILARLEHRHLVRVFASGTHDGEPYFIMPRLAPLPEVRNERLIAACLRDLCHALGYLHAQGLIHRDLKLDNVLVDRDGGFVLGDLGIAHMSTAEAARRFQAEDAHDPTFIGGPKAIGTPGYAAPEQLSGQDITPRTDIHALGVLIERLFNRRIPFAWRLLILAMTSSLPAFRLATPTSVQRAVHLIRLRFAIGIGLCLLLAGGIVGTIALTRIHSEASTGALHGSISAPENWPKLPDRCGQFIPATNAPPNKAILITLPAGSQYHLDNLRAGPVTVRIGGRLEYRRIEVIISGPGILHCPKIIGARVRLENGARLITYRDKDAKESNQFTPIFEIAPDAELIDASD